MAGKLVTEILKYNRDKDCYINKRQLSEIFYYLIKYYEIEEYVKHLYFSNRSVPKNKAVTSDLLFADKSIIMYERTLELYKKVLAGNYTLDDYSYKKVFINEGIIQILIHELMHVLHMKYLYVIKDYNLEYEVLKSSYIYLFIGNIDNLPYLEEYYGTSVKKYFGPNYKEFMKQLKRFDKKYPSIYNYDPSEINAEYESFKEIIFINEYLNPNLNTDWKEMLYSQTKAHYVPSKKGVICPFEKYIKKKNRIFPLDRFDLHSLESEQLPLDTRLSYGLPITMVEYNEMKDHIMSLHS